MDPSTIRIWIDADAAPTDVKEIVYRAAKRLNLQTILVANRRIQVPPALTMVSSVVVSEGADQADRYIVNQGHPGELAITADVPLAEQLVRKGLHVIDPRGEQFDENTIASRLSIRTLWTTFAAAASKPEERSVRRCGQKSVRGDVRPTAYQSTAKSPAGCNETKHRDHEHGRRKFSGPNPATDLADDRGNLKQNDSSPAVGKTTDNR